MLIFFSFLFKTLWISILTTRLEKEARIQLNLFLFDCTPIVQYLRKQLFSFASKITKLANMIGKPVKLAS